MIRVAAWWDTEQSTRPAGAALRVAGVDLIATPDGALVWPERRLLAVADLHLEKGSSLARRGALLPPYDTAATLTRLAALLMRHAPRTLVLLGDSFHDRAGESRMHPVDRERLSGLLATCETVWIAGNHDPDPPVGLPGRAEAVLDLGPLAFRHEPLPSAPPGEIAGHLHPVARVATRGRALRRRCFAGNAARLVLPAFGAYAGGLNVRDDAFGPLFPDGFMAHLLGDAGVFTFAGHRCLQEH